MDERQQARRRAHQAAKAVWARACRRRARLSADDYRQLEGVLWRDVRLRFPALSDEQCNRAVQHGLQQTLPQLFLRHQTHCDGGPADLLNAIDNAGLELLRHGHLEAAGQDDGSAVSDAQFVNAVFGEDDHAYLAALLELRWAGSRMEFLVVTQYVTLRETLHEPPSWDDVAAALTGQGVTAADVERLMFRFNTRLMSSS